MRKLRFRLALYWPALSVLLLVLCWPSSAQAEPYLAIQEGHKCSVCHVNMTGGGKRTDYGNIYVQTRLAGSFFDWRNLGKGEGDDEDYEENPNRTDSKSSFFSGRLNDYIAIGADFRWLWERTETPGEPSENVFNQRKQNIYLEINLIPQRVLFYSTFAGGGDAQEIFGLVQGNVIGEPYYVKAGQFFLPYGLRLQDDTAFVRAVTGFTYGTTDVGVEIGFEPGPWALHLAVTNGTGSSQETNDHKRITASAAYVARLFRLGASYSTNEDAQGVEAKYMASMAAHSSGVWASWQQAISSTTRQWNNGSGYWNSTSLSYEGTTSSFPTNTTIPTWIFSKTPMNAIAWYISPS